MRTTVGVSLDVVLGIQIFGFPLKGFEAVLQISVTDFSVDLDLLRGLLSLRGGFSRGFLKSLKVGSGLSSELLLEKRGHNIEEISGRSGAESSVVSV